MEEGRERGKKKKEGGGKWGADRMRERARGRADESARSSRQINSVRYAKGQINGTLLKTCSGPKNKNVAFVRWT